MARRLIRAGANVNAKNRFGSTPLLDAVLSCGVKRDYKFIELLLENGANHCIKDNDGESPESFSRSNPQLRRLFAKYDASLIKQAKKEEKKAAGGVKICSNCGKANSQRCTGCYLIFYCSVQCQKLDWEDHRSYCTVCMTERLHKNMLFLCIEYRILNAKNL